MQDPKLTLVEILTSARTYRFRSAEALGGWALCTVNDSTGELLIVSDWGNWAHLWSPRHLGSPSLTHFIADRHSYDYLANKLMRGECRVLDADATITKWRRRLTERRLREGRGQRALGASYGALTAYLARDIWEALGSLAQDESNEHVFIEHALQIDGIRWIGDEALWEDTEHRYSHEYRVLVDFLLPALREACAQTVKAQATPAS